MFNPSHTSTESLHGSYTFTIDVYTFWGWTELQTELNFVFWSHVSVTFGIHICNT